MNDEKWRDEDETRTARAHTRYDPIIFYRIMRFWLKNVENWSVIENQKVD